MAITGSIHRACLVCFSSLGPCLSLSHAQCLKNQLHIFCVFCGCFRRKVSLISGTSGSLWNYTLAGNYFLFVLFLRVELLKHACILRKRLKILVIWETEGNSDGPRFKRWCFSLFAIDTHWHVMYSVMGEKIVCPIGSNSPDFLIVRMKFQYLPKCYDKSIEVKRGKVLPRVTQIVSWRRTQMSKIRVLLPCHPYDG